MRWPSFLFFLLVACLGAKQLQVEIKSPAAMLMNSDSEAVLFEKHGYDSLYPASTTKLATALFVLDEKKGNLNEMLTVSADSLTFRPPNQLEGFPPHWWDSDGTRMWLSKGEKLSLETLLHGLLMISGNDAANVIAEGIGGEIPTFVEEMNLYLRKIGCLNTQFLNPHGCHHPEHYTTPYDLCIMMKRSLELPKLREIFLRTSYVKPKSNKQQQSVIAQANRLVLPGERFYYPKAVGAKTGFHSAAQNMLVAAATDQGRTLIAVIGGARGKNDRYEEAIRLFEAAFAETKETEGFFGQQHLFSRKIEGAKTVLSAGLSEELTLSYYPSEKPKCRAFVRWRELRLPIRKKEVVGTVQLVGEKGQVLKEGDLYAKEEVKGTFLYSLTRFLTDLGHK